MISILTIYQSALIFSFYKFSFHKFSFHNIISLFVLMLLISQNGFATETVVNINRAGVEELAERLSGVGPAKARAIVVYRELHGPFKTVDELIKVKGIGPRTLEKNRRQLIVDAKDWLARDHDANASIASGSIHSLVNMEKQTRRAVRSAIEAARHDRKLRSH